MVTTGQTGDPELAARAADLIADAYLGLEQSYEDITSRARRRFEERDWESMATDALQRLNLHGPAASEAAHRLDELLGSGSQDSAMWVAMKSSYSRFASERPDFELAKTFFNSVSRRTFVTVGVDPDIQFLDSDFDRPAGPATISNSKTFVCEDSVPRLIASVLHDCGFSARFRDIDRDARHVAHRVAAQMKDEEVVEAIEVATPVFYRGKGAYVVGRLTTTAGVIPMALALVHKTKGISVDAVLLTENDFSILFSFAHSYFHVENDHPRDLVGFVNEIVPRKRPSELYISLGRVRHGKTELFREVWAHLRSTDEVFVEAPGKRGLVMAVFTLPGFEMVFKVIRDNIPAHKSLTPSRVMEKYRLVFRHDRAGRLVDSQHYERLQFPRSSFEPELAESLLGDCARSVRLEGSFLEISLAYVQRRVIPLDVYLRGATAEQARHAVIEYGNAIRDLAVTGIFPGDMLLKNFGVTRNERVVFYDYDELTEVTRCHFREMPVAANVEDEMAATPWFPLGPDDIFPSEFESFLGLSGTLRDTFHEYHSQLLDASWWRRVQGRIEAGDIVSIYPYSQDLRL